MPFLTLRNVTGNDDPAKYFGENRSQIRAGYCLVDHTRLGLLTPLAEWTSLHVPDEITKISSLRVTSLPEVLSGLKKSAARQRPLLYTHGYYMSFNRGCKRASRLIRNLDLKGRLLLFSWPSDADILNYTRDESDLYWSVQGLERSIAEMVELFGAGQVNLAAHSLGARALVIALVRLSRDHRGPAPLFHDIVLLAPDMDLGIFAQYLPDIRHLALRITVYVSDNDRALALSRRMHGYQRLGESSPHLELLPGVEIIDLSALPVRSVSGHVSHLYNPSMIQDLNRLLNQSQAAADRPGLTKIGKNYWTLRPLDGEN